MSIRTLVHSLSTLLWIILRGAIRIIGAVVKRDFSVAAEWTRVLAWTVLQDCTQAVLLLQRALRPLPPGRDIDRVLVIKLDRIGDMVNATPVFDALHELFPRARVDLVAHPTALQLLEDDDRIAERFPYTSWLYHRRVIVPPGLGTLRLIWRLLLNRYSLVVFLRGSYSFLLLGLTSRLVAFKFVPERSIIDQNLLPLEDFGCAVPHHKPRLKIGESSTAFGRRFWQDAGAAPRVIIHPFANGDSRIWLMDRIAAVADDLAETLGASVHFLGCPNDKAGLENIERFAKHRHDFHHSLTLQQTAAAISTCDLFIGTDSGLSHIAAATGRRMVLIWGFASLAVSRPAASEHQCAILYHDVPCRTGCQGITCANRNRFECLSAIDASQVILAAKRLLNPTDIERPTAVQFEAAPLSS